MKRSRVWLIARTELRQLRQSPDFWLPMLILAVLFFVVILIVLLFVLTHVPNEVVIKKVAVILDVLPSRAKAAIHGFSPAGWTSYAPSGSCCMQKHALPSVRAILLPKNHPPALFATTRTPAASGNHETSRSSRAFPLIWPGTSGAPQDRSRIKTA